MALVSQKYVFCDCTTFSNNYTQKSRYKHYGELIPFVMETTRALESVDASLTKLECTCTCNFVTQYEIARFLFSRMTSKSFNFSLSQKNIRKNYLLD